MSAPAAAADTATTPADPGRDAFRREVRRKVRHAVHAHSLDLADLYAEQIDRAVQTYIDERLGGAR